MGRAVHRLGFRRLGGSAMNETAGEERTKVVLRMEEPIGRLETIAGIMLHVSTSAYEVSHDEIGHFRDEIMAQIYNRGDPAPSVHAYTVIREQLGEAGLSLHLEEFGERFAR